MSVDTECLNHIELKCMAADLTSVNTRLDSAIQKGSIFLTLKHLQMI